MKVDRPGAAIIGAVVMFTIGAVRARDALVVSDLSLIRGIVVKLRAI